MKLKITSYECPQCGHKETTGLEMRNAGTNKECAICGTIMNQID